MCKCSEGEVKMSVQVEVVCKCSEGVVNMSAGKGSVYV